jgi:glycosyltransferase involved in cell wall biosynthesis
MLIYFVNHSSAIDHLGGAERSLITLVEDWYASDPEFEAFFITKAPRGQFVAAIEERGWGYRAYPYRGWALPQKKPHASELTYYSREDYAATGEIISVMEKRRPDLVVTNTLVAPWGAFAAKVLGIPHAWFVREYGDLDHGLSFVNSRAHTLADIGLMSEAVFANSEAIRNHLGQYMEIEKVTIVYPSVEHGPIHQLATENPEIEPFPLAGAGLKITVVGRLARSKGQWRVVEALGLLAANGVEASVCFVGAKMEPDHDLKLLKRARALGVDQRIVFAGEQVNPFPYVAAADVCVTPSGAEAFGRATLEYLWLGKPVVATASGGSSELVRSDINGFLFDPGQPHDLADRLERYSRDPTLLARHQVAALERARYLAEPERGNAAAIERLRALIDQPAYKLPEMARFWFALPSLYVQTHSRSQVTATYIVRIFFVRLRNFVRDPIGSSRRRFYAARARRG